jgi:hypothetical protein
MTVSQGMASPTTVAVFSGNVSDIEESAGAIAHVVTFDVQRVWKGTLTKQVSVYQLNTLDAIPFSAGVPYLIVAYRLRPEERELSGTIQRAPALGVASCVSRTLEQAERLGDLRTWTRTTPSLELESSSLRWWCRKVTPGRTLADKLSGVVQPKRERQCNPRLDPGRFRNAGKATLQAVQERKGAACGRFADNLADVVDAEEVR